MTVREEDAQMHLDMEWLKSLQGRDVPKVLASDIFKVPEEQVTPEQRRFAKMTLQRWLYSTKRPLSEAIATTKERYGVVG